MKRIQPVLKMANAVNHMKRAVQLEKTIMEMHCLIDIPVVNVTWEDAKNYCEYMLENGCLLKRSGKKQGWEHPISTLFMG
jgi:formylglycine-generating enzyme required for sulfatase activity